MQQWLRIGLLILGCLQLVFATGPSHVISLMIPIAINEQGDVLCKHYFRENRMGAHAQMPEKFALCLVKDGKVILLPQEENITPDLEADWEQEFTRSQAMNANFEALSFAPESFLLSSIYRDLQQQGFEPIDLEKYRVTPAFSLDSFQEKWHVDYLEMPQLAVNSRKQPEVTDSFDRTQNLKGTELTYQIGNQLWLQTADNMDWDFDYSDVRIDFYTFPYGEGVMGYDLQTTTSLIFLPSK